MQVNLALCCALPRWDRSCDWTIAISHSANLILIAMEPVSTYSGEPTILSLVNFGSGLALLASDGRSEFIVPRMFVSCSPFQYGSPRNERSVQRRIPRRPVPPPYSMNSRTARGSHASTRFCGRTGRVGFL